MPPGPEDVFGPILVGVLFDAVLLGALAIQVLTYFFKFRRDRIWFRLLIVYLFTVEIINTACDVATAYEPLILQFRNPRILGQAPKFLLADPITTTLVSTPVQLFMAWRISVISRTLAIPILIAVLSAISLGGSVWLSFQIHSDYLDNIRSQGTLEASSLWLVTSAITDVVISLAIVYFICSKRRNMSKDEAMNRYLNRIMRFTVESGALTSFVMILTLLVFLTVKKGPYFLIWDLSISKLYSISLVVSLNARTVKDRYEETRPALFIDDSTMGNTTIATTGSFGAGKAGFDPYPSTLPWVHASPKHPAPAMRTLTTATHHPERNLSVSTVSTISSTTTKSSIRTIYPDETGRYVVGYNVPRKAPPTYEQQPRLQPQRLQTDSGQYV